VLPSRGRPPAAVGIPWPCARFPAPCPCQVLHSNEGLCPHRPERLGTAAVFVFVESSRDISSTGRGLGRPGLTDSLPRRSLMAETRTAARMALGRAVAHEWGVGASFARRHYISPRPPRRPGVKSEVRGNRRSLLRRAPPPRPVRERRYCSTTVIALVSACGCSAGCGSSASPPPPSATIKPLAGTYRYSVTPHLASGSGSAVIQNDLISGKCDGDITYYTGTRTITCHATDHGFLLTRLS